MTSIIGVSWRLLFPKGAGVTAVASENQGSSSVLENYRKLETEGFKPIVATTWDSRSVSTESYRGKILIINFWATWCAPCVEEIPSLLKLVKKYPKSLKLVAISGDSDRSEIESFLKSFPEWAMDPVDMIWDQNKTWLNQFGIERLPESYIFSPDHKLLKKIVGTIDWHTPEALDYMESLFKQYDVVK